MRYNSSILERVREISRTPRKGGNTMPVSKSQQKAVHKYVKANYDRMELTVPKGRKDEIKAHAQALGESVNAFINRAIDHEIARDSGSSPQGRGGASAVGGAVSLPTEGEQAAQRPVEGE